MAAPAEQLQQPMSRGDSPAAAAAAAAVELERLTVLQRAQTAEGRYLEAGRTERRLEELRAGAGQRAMEDLAARQAGELAGLQQQFLEEASAFDAAWGEEMAAVAAARRSAETMLLEKHLTELADLKARQAAGAAAFVPSFRPSPALLNLRRVEAALARQRQFGKAQQVQQQADELQAAELATQAAGLDARQRIESAKAEARQAKEQEALTARLARVESEARLRQGEEMQRMLRRQQAIWADTERGHARARQQLEASLRGALGIKRPSALLALPSLGTSIALNPLASSPKTRTVPQVFPPPQRQLSAAGGLAGALTAGGRGSPSASAKLGLAPHSTLAAGARVGVSSGGGSGAGKGHLLRASDSGGASHATGPRAVVDASAEDEGGLFAPPQPQQHWQQQQQQQLVMSVDGQQSAAHQQQQQPVPDAAVGLLSPADSGGNGELPAAEVAGAAEPPPIETQVGAAGESSEVAV